MVKDIRTKVLVRYTLRVELIRQDQEDFVLQLHRDMHDSIMRLVLDVHAAVKFRKRRRVVRPYRALGNNHMVNMLKSVANEGQGEDREFKVQVVGAGLGSTSNFTDYDRDRQENTIVPRVSVHREHPLAVVGVTRLLAFKVI